MSLNSGLTVPGNTNWQADGKKGIYVDVDTSGAGYAHAPLYFTSIGGKSNHWAVSGSNAVYNATSDGFRIYLRWVDGSDLTPEFANQREWHIKWHGATDYMIHED